MYQLLKFDNPIPSCAIHELIFDEKEKKWTYVYALNTPFTLTNENKEVLLVYEFISDLHLKSSEGIHPESINLKIKTLDEYLALLERQRQEDLRYREKWIKEHIDDLPVPNTISLKNQNYSYKDLQKNNVHYIASCLEIKDDESVFTGR